MTITKRSFILVQEPSDTIVIEGELEDLLVQEMQPILWFRDGLFCIIPVEILLNVLETSDYLLEILHSCVHWGQGQPTHNVTGYALSGLEH